MDDNTQRPKPRSVTIFDIAREAGVSYSTVSRVLNGLEPLKESTRKRVMEAAERLGYVANSQARSLAGGRSHIIGLLVPSMDSGYGYIGEIIRGVEVELERENYDLMLYATRRYIGKEGGYVRNIANGLTDGLILVVPILPSEYLHVLREQNFPYVMVDQADPTGMSFVVESNNRQGAYNATTFLIGQGHRRIGFVTGLMEIHSAVDRLEGYKAALLQHDIPVLDELIVPGDFLQPAGYAAAQQLMNLPEVPTAIFASNDFEAIGAMEAIRERGLQIPDDISIIGFDDIPLASIVYPKLTTVQQPLNQMGRMAARLLLEHLENPKRPPRRITLATQLIVRGSCRSLR